jgi:hypothetical protein
VLGFIYNITQRLMYFNVQIYMNIIELEKGMFNTDSC